MAEPKPRHGCLTAWLVLMIIANSGAVIMYLLAGNTIRQNLPNAAPWAIPLLIVLGIINIICAIALFQWKKWGFFGFVVTSAIAFGINLSVGLGIGKSLLGLLGLAILYGVLQIGNENKAWNQLE